MFGLHVYYEFTYALDKLKKIYHGWNRTCDLWNPIPMRSRRFECVTFRTSLFSSISKFVGSIPIVLKHINFFSLADVDTHC